MLIGRSSLAVPAPAMDLAVERLCRAGLATMILDLPDDDPCALAGWVEVGAASLRDDLGARLPVAYLGAGTDAAPGWIAAAAGGIDAVVAWNARPWGAWAHLPRVGTPSLLVTDERDPVSALYARAAKWRLGGRADVVAGAAPGSAGLLADWYADRLLRAPILRPLSEPAAVRRRMASVGVAAALAAAPAGAFAASVAARPAAAATATAGVSIPDFTAGTRLAAAQIGGDNAAAAPQTRAASPAPGNRLTGAAIGGDRRTKSTGSKALIDGIGVKWFDNTNITFQTSSSASGAASEASFTHAVQASTANGGTVASTLNDAFDGYNALCLDLNNVGGQCNPSTTAMYNQNGLASLECSNRQVVFPPKTMGNFQVSRKFFVPAAGEGFGRWLDIVKNTSASQQTVRLQTSNNLGSDSSTTIITTSDGDTTPEVTDTWVTSFQNFSGTTSSDPRLGHVLQGPGAPVGLSAISFVNGDDNPFWRYQFTIDPGQTKIIMNFATAQATKSAAATESAALASLSSAHALDCMSDTEKAEVANFLLAKATPTISTHASAGGPVGTSLSDSATLSGGAGPTGNVTFKLFSNFTCTSQVFTSTNNLSGTTATSGGFIPQSPGTYYWTAVYNGDANNNTATSPCNAPNESSVIGAFVPPPCTTTVTGDVPGPYVVNSGQNLCLTGATVHGAVTVNGGGALTVSRSQLLGGVTSTGASSFSVCNSFVTAAGSSPAIAVQGSSGPIQIGDVANNCAANRVTGNALLTGNTSVLTFANNLVTGNVTINNTSGYSFVKRNGITMSLACSGNAPPPSNGGQPNSAASKTGQCAAL